MPYIVDLEHKNKESVGFLPTMAIEQRLQKGHIYIGRIHGEPFGYLLFDRRAYGVHVLQACIQYDARRRLYGASLYGWALQQWNPDLVTLKCAADLESNLFWRSLGLICMAVVNGGKRRNRKINIWHHVLRPDAFLFDRTELAVTPASQYREDCYDAETGFLSVTPDGFRDAGRLGKLAWKSKS